MSLLYQRKSILTIGKDGEKGKEFENLRFTFEIDKFKDSTPNQAKISLTNLTKETQNYIKKGMQISVKAGYKDDYGLLFVGTIDKIDTEKPKPDVYTNIESKDGVKQFTNGFVTKSFTGNTDLKTVIDFLISELGFSKGNVSGIPTNQKIKNGLSLHGYAKKYLDEFSKTYNFKWSVQDNLLYILGKKEKINREAILLNATSGLIGSPEKTEKGFKIKSLLRWGLVPGNYIKVESEKVTNFFEVGNIKHTGDSRGQNWYTELEVFE